MAVLSHTAMLWPLLVAVKHKVPFAPLVDIGLNLYHDLTSPTMLLDDPLSLACQDVRFL
jgi:hypothetical protein